MIEGFLNSSCKNCLSLMDCKWGKWCFKPFNTDEKARIEPFLHKVICLARIFFHRDPTYLSVSIYGCVWPSIRVSQVTPTSYSHMNHTRATSSYLHILPHRLISKSITIVSQAYRLVPKFRYD